MNKLFQVFILIAVAVFTVIVVYLAFRQSPETKTRNIAPFDIQKDTFPYNSPESDANFEKTTSPELIETITGGVVTSDSADEMPKSSAPDLTIAPSVLKIQEVSPRNFTELVNSAVVQIYCGRYNGDKTTLSNIARGTGVLFNEKGELLTNRHIIYDFNSKQLRSDCFVLKSPFPNEKSENPKIYYIAEIEKYPVTERFSDSFSADKYYNDFAVLKIISKPASGDRINFLLGFDYAMPDDYFVIERAPDSFNFLPIDWDYQPKDGDSLITLGYGIDAAHIANKITSTIGKLFGNISVDGSGSPQILLIESNSTSGFSGGALINPQSKGLVGLISWVTSGEEQGKYTVAIFRDFLRTLMIQDLNLDLK